MAFAIVYHFVSSADKLSDPLRIVQIDLTLP